MSILQLLEINKACAWKTNQNRCAADTEQQFSRFENVLNSYSNLSYRETGVERLISSKHRIAGKSRECGDRIESRMQLAEGSVIKGTYVVERYIGGGSFGEVYRVRHKFLGRQAMKVFRECGVSEEEIVELLREALLLSKIGHPNVIRVFEANVLDEEYGSRGYFTMEYVPGGTLDEYMKSRHFVPQDEALNITRQICAGVAVAHTFKPGIIHRDLKPQNVLVGYEETGFSAKVSDFGLAEAPDKLTGFAPAAGSLMYEPPEAFEGLASFAGDVFAIGMIFYEMLTGRLPFEIKRDINVNDRNDLRELLVESRRRKPADSSKINDAVDPLVDPILQKAMEFNAKDRYKNAQKMFEAVSACEKSLREANRPVSGVLLVSKSRIKVESSNLAKNYLQKALDLSKQACMLEEATDCLQKAFMIDPSLREKYVYLLKNWRKGVVM